MEMKRGVTFRFRGEPGSGSVREIGAVHGVGRDRKPTALTNGLYAMACELELKVVATDLFAGSSSSSSSSKAPEGALRFQRYGAVPGVADNADE